MIIDADEQRKKLDQIRGLGDTIAKITKAVGIKPCGGCKKRQAILNKAVPYGTRNKVEGHKGHKG